MSMRHKTHMLATARAGFPPPSCFAGCSACRAAAWLRGCPRAERYGYYWRSDQGKPGAPPAEQNLVREGFFATRLAETLKIGEVKSEAEAEGKLASVGILPKNGWIADYPLTPKVSAELENAIGEAADSGKIAMKRDEAIKLFKDLVVDIENEYAQAEPPPGNQPYPERYVYPYPYFYPYYYPYPYYFGYYRFYYPYPYFRHWR